MTPENLVHQMRFYRQKIIKFALKLPLKFIIELFGEQELKFRHILLIYKYLRK